MFNVLKGCIRHVIGCCVTREGGTIQPVCGPVRNKEVAGGHVQTGDTDHHGAPPPLLQPGGQDHGKVSVCVRVRACVRACVRVCVNHMSSLSCCCLMLSYQQLVWGVNTRTAYVIYIRSASEEAQHEAGRNRTLRDSFNIKG